MWSGCGLRMLIAMKELFILKNNDKGMLNHLK
jgi:hypothetical protein